MLDMNTLVLDMNALKGTFKLQPHTASYRQLSSKTYMYVELTFEKLRYPTAEIQKISTYTTAASVALHYIGLQGDSKLGG